VSAQAADTSAAQSSGYYDDNGNYVDTSAMAAAPATTAAAPSPLRLSASDINYIAPTASENIDNVDENGNLISYADPYTNGMLQIGTGANQITLAAPTVTDRGYRAVTNSGDSAYVNAVEGQAVRVLGPDGNVLYEGTGPTAARDAVALGTYMTQTDGSQASYTIQTGDLNNPGGYVDQFHESVDKPKSDVFGTILDVALPIVASLIAPGIGTALGFGGGSALTGGSKLAAMAIGAGLGSGASSAIQGRSASDALSRALMSAAGSYVGGSVLPKVPILGHSVTVGNTTIPGILPLIDKTITLPAQNALQNAVGLGGGNVLYNLPGALSGVTVTASNALNSIAGNILGSGAGSAAANLVKPPIDLTKAAGSNPLKVTQDPKTGELTSTPVDVVAPASGTGAGAGVGAGADAVAGANPPVSDLTVIAKKPDTTAATPVSGVEVISNKPTGVDTGAKLTGNIDLNTTPVPGVTVTGKVPVSTTGSTTTPSVTTNITNLPSTTTTKPVSTTGDVAGTLVTSLPTGTSSTGGPKSADQLRAELGSVFRASLPPPSGVAANLGQRTLPSDIDWNRYAIDYPQQGFFNYTAPSPSTAGRFNPTSAITEDYRAVLGRAPDTAGMDYWTNLAKQEVAAGGNPTEVLNSILAQFKTAKEAQSSRTTKFAAGGHVDDFAVQSAPRNDFVVKGPGTGRSDSIAAKLSDGEYVMDAETVALLGDGSSKAGAQKLDQLRVNIRKQKGRALAKGKFSPNAKAPQAYLSGGRV
jgi:hypothetical protein